MKLTQAQSSALLRLLWSKGPLWLHHAVGWRLRAVGLAQLYHEPGSSETKYVLTDAGWKRARKIEVER